MSTRALVKQLSAVGFWDHLTAERRKEAKAAVRRGTPPLETIDRAGWVADGEDLAEGEVETFLAEIAPALAPLGVTLEVETLTAPHAVGTATGYVIAINQRVLELYRYIPDSALPDSADPWLDCTLKPLSVVNGLLESAGTTLRIAVVGAGANDGMAYLLPADAIAVLAGSSAVTERDRPICP